MTENERATLIDFLERQWLTPDVKEAYRSLFYEAYIEAETKVLRAEIERLKKRCHPQEAFF